MTVGIAIYSLYTYKAIPCLLVGKQGNKYTLCLMLRVLVSISIEDVQLGLSSIALP